MIVVTGATGAIGGELVRLLAAARQPMRVLVRRPEKAISMSGLAEVVQGDLLQPATLKPAFAGATSAFVMLGTIQDLPTASGPIFQAAERAGVRHVVFLSSGTIAIEPPSTVGAWHLEGERQLKATSLAWTMLRPGNFASNTLRWAGPIKGQGSVFLAHRSHRTPVIDPRDIAAVAAKALTSPGHEGKTYVLTGPAPITAEEQVAALGKALGKALTIVDVPEAGARAGMVKGGMSEVLADAVLELQRPGRTLPPVVSSAVADVTGRPPRTFEDWVKDHLGAFA